MRFVVNSSVLCIIPIGRYTAIPAFVGIMALVFYLTFGVIGLALQNLLEVGIDALTAAVDSTLTAWNVNAAVHSLVIDGIFSGVGSVLSFLPIILTLFFFLSLLEDQKILEKNQQFRSCNRAVLGVSLKQCNVGYNM